MELYRRVLRIKKFYGTSENAVKTQIWIAVSVYVLVAIVKKRLDLGTTKAAVKMHTLLDLRGNSPSFIHISPRTCRSIGTL